MHQKKLIWIHIYCSHAGRKSWWLNLDQGKENIASSLKSRPQEWSLTASISLSLFASFVDFLIRIFDIIASSSSSFSFSFTSISHVNDATIRFVSVREGCCIECEAANEFEYVVEEKKKNMCVTNAIYNAFNDDNIHGHEKNGLVWKRPRISHTSAMIASYAINWR